MQRIKPRNADKNEIFSDISEFDAFFADVERIRNCKSLRRLAYKTQVFTLPNNPHVRTRRAHTDEVVSVALAIARQINLLESSRLNVNEKLVEAIALGHDVGHTPFGHGGESYLGTLREGFRHEKNSVVLLELVERQGEGLGLTKETLLGILRHSRGKGSMSINEGELPEHTIAMYADKIAYLFADVKDAYRYGYTKDEPFIAMRLGETQRERTKRCINSLVQESGRKGFISFNDSLEAELFNKLKLYMYQEVYPKADSPMKRMMLEEICNALRRELPDHDNVLLASMLTDVEVMRLADFPMSGTRITKEMLLDPTFIGISEIIPYTEGFKVDYTKVTEQWVESL